jgi:hypothetical protein
VAFSSRSAVIRRCLHPPRGAETAGTLAIRRFRLDVPDLELTILLMNQPPTGPTSGLVRALGGMALQSFKDALGRPKPEQGALSETQEPPVVAQLMIEIRSDGSHTIARGALHDLRSQESAHVHAEGKTPAQLIASLLGSLLSLPGGTFERLRNPTDAKPDTRRIEVLPHESRDKK